MAEKKEEEDIWQCSECYSTEVKITTSDGNKSEWFNMTDNQQFTVIKKAIK